ncbi:hypothetical protein [Sphingopyxis alaskensis]|uniref:hypothetical protein n=1 Tax=Sphingopyxis alaskensis TaxID=117207 RepID=UPI0039190C17
MNDLSFMDVANVAELRLWRHHMLERERERLEQRQRGYRTVVAAVAAGGIVLVAVLIDQMLRLSGAAGLAALLPSGALEMLKLISVFAGLLILAFWLFDRWRQLRYDEEILKTRMLLLEEQDDGSRPETTARDTGSHTEALLERGEDYLT